MGIGPLVAWRRASLRSLGRTFLVAARCRASSRASRCSRAAPARRVPGADRVHVLGVRARVDRARVRARHGARALGSRGCRARSSPQPPPLRRLRRARGDRAARDRRSPARARTRPCASAGGLKPGPVDDDRRLHARLPRLETKQGANDVARPRDRRRLTRRRRTSRRSSPGKNSYPREQQISNEVSIYHDPRTRRRPVPDRRPDRRRTARIVPEGAREAARQPDLAGRLRLRRRLARRALAGRREERRLADRYATGAIAGMTLALVLGGRARARRASSSSRGRFSASRRPRATCSTSPDELEQRRLALVEERDRALAALKELEFDHRTGKVSDDDYRALVGPLRRRAARGVTCARAAGRSPRMSASAPAR